MPRRLATADAEELERVPARAAGVAVLPGAREGRRGGTAVSHRRCAAPWCGSPGAGRALMRAPLAESALEGSLELYQRSLRGEPRGVRAGCFSLRPLLLRPQPA